MCSVATTTVDCWTWIWSIRHYELGQSGLLISMLEKFNLFCLTNLVTLVLLMWKKDGSFLEGKSSFKIVGLSFLSKLDWGFCNISIAKTVSKKFGALIRFIEFLSSKDALYLYKSTIRLCMESCCHVWVGAPSCYLVM